MHTGGIGRRDRNRCGAESLKNITTTGDWYYVEARWPFAPHQPSATIYATLFGW